MDDTQRLILAMNTIAKLWQEKEEIKEGITTISEFVKNKFWSSVDENGIRQYTETVRDLLKMLYQVQMGRNL